MPNEMESNTKRTRSPNYPAVGLRDAVERATSLYEADKRAASPLESAVKHLGFNRPHGTAMSVISAMRKFGLVEMLNNRVSLTDRAVAILVYPADDPRRIEALKAAATAPEIYRDLVERYSVSGSIPSEETLKAELQHEMKFNPSAVNEFVKEFKDTLLYSGLLDSDGVTLRWSNANRIKVGDYIQWESNGTLQFQEPKRVREVSEDGKFAFVDGSNTGLPMSELSQAKLSQSNKSVLYPDPKAFDGIFDSSKKTLKIYSFGLSDETNAELRIFGEATVEDLEALRDYVELTIKNLSRKSRKAEA
jgi:hypothetical protein